ncbi:glycosyltransferase family 1 protein [Bacillus megaterium]|nr:glycosyltransferase family 1 protein [Priestia megaterium]
MNNRTFDISACGAFQLVDYKEDLYSQYNEDEIVHYINPSDCLDKIHYFIHEENSRKNYW